MSSSKPRPGPAATPRHVPGVSPASQWAHQPSAGPSKASESVTERLQRLRVEHRRHDRNINASKAKALPPHLPSPPSTPSPSTSTTRPCGAMPLNVALAASWLQDIDVATPRGAVTTVTRDPRRSRVPKEGGHAAPPSWTTLKEETAKLDLSKASNAGDADSLAVDDHCALSMPELAARRRILFPPSDPRPPQTTLFDACLRRIANDLTLIPPSLIEDFPPRWKERIMDLAAEWSPLGDQGATALLSRSTTEPDGETSSKHGSSDEGEEGGEWDREGFVDEISSGNLSFSTLTLSTLRRLFLSIPTKPAPFLCDSDPRRSITPSLLHPHVTSLSLSGCPNLTLSPGLLSLLSLLPLRQLSICAIRWTVCPELALSKLAASTSRLQSVDLSYNPSWAGLRELRDFDWPKKWQRLEKLGVRGNVRLIGEDHPGEPAWATKAEEKEEDRQWRITTVRDCLLGRRLSGGLWIDIIV